MCVEQQQSDTDLQGSEVDDIIDIRMLFEHLVERSFILDIELVELWPLAADELNTVDDLLGGVVKVIDDDDLVARLEKGKRCERANVAGTTAVVSMQSMVEVGWRGSSPSNEDRADSHCGRWNVVECAGGKRWKRKWILCVACRSLIAMLQSYKKLRTQ